MYKPYAKLTIQNVNQIIEGCISRGYALKEEINNDYRQYRTMVPTRISVWEEWITKWHTDTLKSLDLVFDGNIPSNQFKHLKPSAMMGLPANENMQWGNIQNYLDVKIDFLIQLNNQLRPMEPQNISGIVAGGNITAGRDIIVNGKKTDSESSFFQKPGGQLLLSVVGGLILAGIVYYLGWN